MVVRKKADEIVVNETPVNESDFVQLHPVAEEIIEPGTDEPALEEIIPQPEFKIPENRMSGMGIREN